jgi:hypothetical protein
VGKIESANKTGPQRFYYACLESSPWKGEVYINSLKGNPDRKCKAIRTYLTRVFDGHRLNQNGLRDGSIRGAKGKGWELLFLPYYLS